MRNIRDEIKRIEEELNRLPKGTLVYKTINGKQQPYLQWTEDRKTKSCYIKVDERDQILLDIERREELKTAWKRLKSYQEKTLHILQKNPYLDRTPGIGHQDFATIMDREVFYVDKTYFLKEWWESEDQITLITRPRRFGKTLTLSMVDTFFSTIHASRRSFFEDLAIWKSEEYRKLQGTFPVIFMTFAGVKDNKYEGAHHTLNSYLHIVYSNHEYLMESEALSVEEKESYRQLNYRLGHMAKEEPSEKETAEALLTLSKLLYKHHGKKVLILLDEYDTPLQEAYFSGYWDEMISLMRNFFNRTFKSNPYLDKALLTGITRVAQESLFSDMNNLGVYTVTSDKYADVFGFTEKEVFEALECQGIQEQEKAKVKEWYDGFTFGKTAGIYNPWSIINFLSYGAVRPYWVHTSSNRLVSELFLQGRDYLMDELELLLKGKSLHKVFDENIVFQNLSYDSEAIWPLLLATGYLKAEHVVGDEYIECDLSVTNRETMFMFRKMVKDWFMRTRHEYSEFVKAMLRGNVEYMNYYMNEIAMDVVSVFDVGRRPSGKAPERFYHGFVLGLVVELRDQYRVTSNKESGLGRYDVMLEPLQQDMPAMIMEFKVFDPKKEDSLEDTARAALQQIADKGYETELIKRGFSNDQIASYGFAFEGKEVLILQKKEKDM